MWRFLVIVLAIGVSGCTAKTGLTYRTAQQRGGYMSRFPRLQELFPLFGKVPLGQALDELRRRGLVKVTPPIVGIIDLDVEVRSGWRVADVIRAIELAAGWIYDPDKLTFYHATATHSVDQPDSFGRPQSLDRVPLAARPVLSVAFRFRRIVGGLSNDAVSAGGNETVMYLSLPDGVRESVTSAQERSYFEGVTNTQSGRTVATTRRSVEAGVIVDLMAARLPGGYFRLDGHLEISSFTGEELNKSTVDLPLQMDGPRGQWVRCLVISGVSADAQLAFRRLGFTGALSGDALELSVRVE